METEGNPGLEELLARMEHEKAWDYERKAKQILSQLKIGISISGSNIFRRVQLKTCCFLANVLITEPDFLILDEPTNHLDLDMTEWLEECETWQYQSAHGDLRPLFPGPRLL